MSFKEVSRLLNALKGTFAEVNPVDFIRHQLEDSDDRRLVAISVKLEQVIAEEVDRLPQEMREDLVKAARSHLADVRENFRSLSQSETTEFHQTLIANAKVIEDILTLSNDDQTLDKLDKLDKLD